MILLLIGNSISDKIHCIRFDLDYISNLRTTMLWTGQNGIYYNDKSLAIKLKKKFDALQVNRHFYLLS